MFIRDRIMGMETGIEGCDGKELLRLINYSNFG